jgi:AAA domain
VNSGTPYSQDSYYTSPTGVDTFVPLEPYLQHKVDRMSDDAKDLLIEALRNRNGSVVEYNDIILQFLGANVASYLTGTKEVSKIICAYVLKYVLKSKVDVQMSINLLSDALDSIAKRPSSAEDAGTEMRTAKLIVQRYFCKQLAAIEFSTAQAADLLLGGKEFNFSDAFSYAFVSALVNEAKSRLQQYPVVGDDESEWTDVEDDADSDLNIDVENSESTDEDDCDTCSNQGASDGGSSVAGSDGGDTCCNPGASDGGSSVAGSDGGEACSSSDRGPIVDDIDDSDSIEDFFGTYMDEEKEATSVAETRVKGRTYLLDDGEVAFVTDEENYIGRGVLDPFRYVFVKTVDDDEQVGESTGIIYDRQRYEEEGKYQVPVDEQWRITKDYDEGLQRISYYEYVSIISIVRQTKKEKQAAAKAGKDSGRPDGNTNGIDDEVQEDNAEEGEGEGEGDENEERNDRKKEYVRGRKKNLCIPFDPSHQLYKTHHQQLRSKIHTPRYATGIPPPYPRIKGKITAEDAAKQDAYAMTILCYYDEFVPEGFPRSMIKKCELGSPVLDENGKQKYLPSGLPMYEPNRYTFYRPWVAFGEFMKRLKQPLVNELLPSWYNRCIHGSIESITTQFRTPNKDRCLRLAKYRTRAATQWKKMKEKPDRAGDYGKRPGKAGGWPNEENSAKPTGADTNGESGYDSQDECDCEQDRKMMEANLKIIEEYRMNNDPDLFDKTVKKLREKAERNARIMKTLDILSADLHKTADNRIPVKKDDGSVLLPAVGLAYEQKHIDKMPTSCVFECDDARGFYDVFKKDLTSAEANTAGASNSSRSNTEPLWDASCKPSQIEFLRVCEAALRTWSDAVNNPTLLPDEVISRITGIPTVLLDGGPGTGKSFSIGELKKIASHFGADVICLGPTGTAAANLEGGRTCHSFGGFTNRTNMKEAQGDIVSHDTLELKVNVLSPAPIILVIDEISMVSPEFYYNIGLRTRQFIMEKRKCTKGLYSFTTFSASMGLCCILMQLSLSRTLSQMYVGGGIFEKTPTEVFNSVFANVILILSGDFKQLPPTRGESLPKAVIRYIRDPHGRHYKAPESPYTLGVTHFMRNLRLCRLTEQNRSEDPQHTAWIDRLRNAVEFPQPITEEFLSHLRGRQLTKEMVEKDHNFYFATRIVLLNDDRRMLNRRLMIDYARYNKQPLIRFRYKMSGAIASSLSEAERNAFYEAYPEYFEGCFSMNAPCILSENMNPSKGAANGTLGRFVGVHYELLDSDDEETREAKLAAKQIIRDAEETGDFQNILLPIVPDFCVVDITASVADTRSDIETLVEGRRVILVPFAKKPENNPHGFALMETVGNIIAGKPTSISWTQHAVEPAFAITVDKSQGKTLSYVLFDLNKVIGRPFKLEMVIVGFSRCKVGANFAIFPLANPTALDHLRNLKHDPDINHFFSSFNAEGFFDWKLAEKNTSKARMSVAQAATAQHAASITQPVKSPLVPSKNAVIVSVRAPIKRRSCDPSSSSSVGDGAIDEQEKKRARRSELSAALRSAAALRLQEELVHTENAMDLSLASIEALNDSRICDSAMDLSVASVEICNDSRICDSAIDLSVASTSIMDVSIECDSDLSLKAQRYLALTDVENERVDDIFSGPSSHEVVISNFNVEMTRNKLFCLKPDVWLNDEDTVGEGSVMDIVADDDVIVASNRQHRLRAIRYIVQSSEETERVDSVLCGPDNYDVVIAKFNVEMTRSKMLCLRPEKWLNDEVRENEKQPEKTVSYHLIIA